METTTIAGAEVSRIGLDTWAIGGLEWGKVSDEAAVATCLSALERGINLIDTAPIYGHGRSEEVVGKAIRAHGRREDFYVATKAGLEWNASGVFTNSTGRGCAASWKRACAAWARSTSTSTRFTGPIL
jgi:aryl-alcohol dehydrogenase-like predicted oxidoreductase